MENIVPVEKNNDYILDIAGIASEGEGVGKIEGFTVFVAGALKGERVKIKIVKLSKNHAYGKLLEIIEGSPERVEPLCPIYKRCGGCNIQHMSYGAQLLFKKEKVIGCLTRIGKLQISENYEENKTRVGNTIGMTTPYRYRNKVQLPIGEQDGEAVVGFYAPRSHEIIKMEHCLIQEEVADEIVHILKQWIKKNKIQVYNEMNNQGILRHIMIRKAFKTGEVMVVIVTNGNYLPSREEFIQVMKDKVPGIKSIIHNINSKNTNLVLGEKCITLWGSDTISDYIGEFKFNISPLSFFQVNPIQTEVLYAKALEFAALTGEETVFDAYCGTGTISLFLSKKAKKVYGIEVVPEAIENAKLNAAENNVDNVEFLVGQCEQIIPQLIKQGKRAQVVVVDPPRKGCEKSLLEAIASISPDRIVYVSCDPGTLARDLGILKELGYETKEVQPVDMFPQTGHVECVVLIEKK